MCMRWVRLGGIGWQENGMHDEYVVQGEEGDDMHGGVETDHRYATLINVSKEWVWVARNGYDMEIYERR